MDGIPLNLLDDFLDDDVLGWLSDFPGAAHAGAASAGGGAASWSGGGAAAASPAHRTPADAAGAAPPSPDAPGDGVAYTCLLSSCPNPCDRCRPPPPPEEARHWRLAGERGKKNGEKHVRSGLTCSPQWRDAGVRLAAAARAEAAGDAELGAVLRRKDSSALRKRHFFTLCAWWRYKCHVWVPNAAAEGDSGRRRAATTADANALAVVVVPRVRRTDDLPPALEPELRAALAAYAAAGTNSRLFAAGFAEPDAPCAVLPIETLRGFLPMLAASISAAYVDADTIGAHAASLAAAGDADEPIWLAPTPDVLLRAERHVQLSQSSIMVSGEVLRRFDAVTATAAAPALEAALMSILRDDSAALSALVARCDAALAQLRATNVRQYAAAAALVAACLGDARRIIRRKLEEKIAWVESRASHVAPPQALHPATETLYRQMRSRSMPLAQTVGADVANRLTEALQVPQQLQPPEEHAGPTGQHAE